MSLAIAAIPAAVASPYSFEFHVSRRARDRYRFAQSLFATDGGAIVANFAAAREFAHAMNLRRDTARHPERAVKAADINAMGLLDELSHLAIETYRQRHNGKLWSQALAALETNLGPRQLDAALLRFVEEFPPLAVYRAEIEPAAYLAIALNRETALQELLMLWLTNANPAQQPYRELFDDANLETSTAYFSVISGLHDFLETQPRFGPKKQTLIEFLRAPMLAMPNSLSGQLRFVLEQWEFLGEEFRLRLLRGLDFISEEERASFSGPGPSEAPDYAAAQSLYGRYHETCEADAEEAERFSPDRDWMPRAVIMAKNTFVWLDQLSRKYGRAIDRLDQIPNEELAELAAQGFSGLWLIGLWERSKASRRIKQLCGKEDAHASAYSVFDYVIAADLGGDWAMDDLRRRAWEHGIRMTSDMVPNHMAIDSRWVQQHPDWFISVPHPPYPAYSFEGADLSEDGRVGIYLEDHYYDREDAAVVFKRVDRRYGDTRYIYHGNDGTSMPWNDTAQLDYLKPEVREAVIQTILHVARQFPIIRFDAAMTLAKRHYQRLWYPEPGTAGAVPSRAEHGLSKAAFNAAMPHEFWREVVDRVAAEAPDTLLLAEAFWMMEGYFVRTLGMHRVYNSAFMNMLRDEENAKYRLVIKNTLEFDPEILKRFVNFINNPDEETAARQFGTGDKYFGICALMCTLPGLPMFGHGQIEGYTEKYGMEFSRAKWDEQPNEGLIQRHQRDIFPLLKRRYLFSEVEAFVCYDFWNDQGGVNEDVFAYSNRCGAERGLVVYHNRYADAHGWIRTSVAALNKASGNLEQKSLGDGLGLSHDAGCFTVFRESASGLQFIRRNDELCERGLRFDLGAYDCRVFLDFQEVRDSERGEYARLERELGGGGVPSIESALRDLDLQPVREPFHALVNADMLRTLIDAAFDRHDEAAGAPHIPALERAEMAVHTVAEAMRAYHDENGGEGAAADAAELARRAGADLWTAMKFLGPGYDQTEAAGKDFERHNPTAAALLAWLLIRHLGDDTATEATADRRRPIAGHRARAYFDEYGWTPALQQALAEFGASGRGEHLGNALLWLLENAADFGSDAATYATLELLLNGADGRATLGVNEFEGVLWFGKEAADEVLPLLLAVAELNIDTGKTALAHPEAMALLARLSNAIEKSGYQVEKLLDELKPAMAAPKEAAQGALPKISLWTLSHYWVGARRATGVARSAG